MENATDTPQTLLQTISPGSEIRLLNVYKGIPISYPATVIEIGPKMLRVRTDRLQLACLYREKETYIQGSSFVGTFRVKAAELDLKNFQAVLVEFQVAPDRLGIRAQVRVEPGETVHGEIFMDDLRDVLFGELADISHNGIGLYFSKRYVIPEAFKSGSPVAVTIHLPGLFDTGLRTPGVPPTVTVNPIDRFDRENIRLLPLLPKQEEGEETGGAIQRIRSPRVQIKGVIAYTHIEDLTGRCRMGILINPGDSSKALIAQFIAQRQTQIIREIRALSQLFSEEIE